MQIVIDIPDDIYEQTINGTEYDTLSLGIKLRQSVQEGIVIPKGHGDLIDRKELTKYPPIWMEDKRRTGEDDAVMLLSDILKAEPVIEADKE